MRLHTLLAWGLTASFIFGITGPALAKRDEDWRRGNEQKVRVIVKESNDQDDVRAFEQWYGLQLRSYDGIEPETGERYANLLQMVTDVTRDQVMVTDQQGLRRGVFITSRTQIIPEDNGGRGTALGLVKPTGPAAYTSRQPALRPGDLVIVQGYLKVTGGIVATSIRVMGRARGYEYENDRSQPTYGYRVWGDVREVDARRGRLVVNLNIGIRTITLERNADVLVDRERKSLEYLRRGDRVVVYYRDRDRDDNLTAYRVALLRGNDRYPDGNRPCPTDPDYRDGGYTTGPTLEGRLQSVTTGIFFNKLVVKSNTGRDITVRFSKTLMAIDQDGDAVSIVNLRFGERIRINYADVAGNFFAERIEVD